MGCRLLRWQRTNHLANPFPGPPPPPPPGGLSTIELRCSHCQERMWCWGHRDASCDVLITATAHLPLPSLCTEGRRGSHWFKGLLFFSLPLSRPLSSSLSLCLAVAVSSLFFLSFFFLCSFLSPQPLHRRFFLRTAAKEM